MQTLCVSVTKKQTNAAHCVILGPNDPTSLRHMHTKGTHTQTKIVRKNNKTSAKNLQGLDVS